MTFFLIDNYDSFTYNLAHSLAAASGAMPVVVRNDDVTGITGIEQAAASGTLDGIVVSPGPGHPAVPRDFGISAWALGQEATPLLGICLGHQGLCLHAGARVEPAPEPVHGRTSVVRHTGDELFDGIPTPFEAMRYHSLLVYDAPAQLEVIATTDDGLIMAVRHRDRPHWGVQFHPESIATAAGERLVANFVASARRHNRAGRRRTAAASPARSVHAEPGADAAHGRPRAGQRQRGAARQSSYRLVVREVAALTDGPSAFQALFGDDDLAFWLDSAAGVPGLSRFSMMGCASGPLGEVVSYDAASTTVTVTSSRGPVSTTADADVLTYLDRELRARRVAPAGLPADFSLGYVGYLGYELLGTGPGMPSRHRSTTPDAVLLFADRGVLVDHVTGRTYLLALTTRDELGNLAWLAEAASRLTVADILPTPVPPDRSERPAVVPRHSDERYLELIDECRRQILRGESYEICLTNMFEVDCRVDPWHTYRRLRTVNPAPFASFLRLGPELAVLSSSPERFVRVSADGLVESSPIKGTCARGSTPARDELAALQLATSEKERAENLMIVDLVRNDLGRTARTGSVHVPVLCGIETYETVHQMVSTVLAALRPDTGAAECVRHAFPGGSMTGAPKRRTMEIIEQLEGGPRGVYSGAIGYFSLDGAADLSITIRTLVVSGGRVTLGVGGAITALSDPLAELGEIWLKADALLEAVGQEMTQSSPSAPSRQIDCNLSA